MGRKKAPVEVEPLDEDEEGESSPGFFAWLVRRAILLSVLGGAGVALAPNAISGLGLTDQFVGPWLPSRMQLSLGRNSLAWWSPVTCENVRYRSADGSVTVEVEKLTTTKTLLGLALSPQSFGAVRLEKPTVAAVVAKKAEVSTDKPAELKPAVKDTIDSILSGLHGTVEAVDGSVRVEDGLGGTWSLTSVAAKVEIAPSATSAFKGEWSGQVADVPSSVVKGTVSVETADRKGAIAQGKIEATAFPLGMLNPILAWGGSETRLGGSLTGIADFDFDPESGRLRIDSESKASRLLVQSPALAPDELLLESLESQVKIAIAGSTIEIEDSRLVCELGEVKGLGKIDGTRLQDPARQDLTVEGTIDLPTLARKLPTLARIREGVVIESGQLALSVRPVADSAGKWDGVAEVREFRGRHDGQPVEWPKPVSLTARAGQADEGWVVDQFACESDFLRAKGSGSLSSFDVSAVCDLSRLQDRLGELLDLGDTKLAGRMSARVQSQKTASGGIAVRGATKAEGLMVRLDGETIAHEDQVDGQFQLASANTSLSAISSAAIVIKNAREHLNAHLVGSLDDWEKGSWGTWDIQASGDLAELVRRANTVSTLFAETKASGVGVLSGRFSFEPQETRFEKLLVDVQGLAYASPTMQIQDRRVRLETEGRWNGDDLALSLGTTTLVGETVQFRSNELKGRLTEEGLALVCRADVAGDVASVRRWTGGAGGPDEITGQFEGRVAIESDGKRWGATIEGGVNDFRYGPATAPILDERRIDLAGRAATDSAGGAISLQDFRVGVPGLVVTASGTLEPTPEAQVVDLRGLMEYDWETLSPRLRGMVGEQVVLEGKDRRSFRLKGPIQTSAKMEFAAAREQIIGRYPGLDGEFSLGWQRANIYGFAAGPANIDGKLADSWMVTQPVSFPLNQGKMMLRPGLFFGTKATYLHHPAGRLAERVQLTREMCDGALQYIAPVLAKSVDVKGYVSLDVEEVKVPLGHLDQADFRGKILLEEAQATGSPLVRELLVLTEGQPIVELAKESEIRFRVAEGRVYHEGLQIKIPGMVIQTSGYVGLDRTLELTAEMPIPPRWYPNEKVRERLAGQKIRVPIGGTLDEPRLDKQMFQKQVGRMIEENAGRFIEGEINRQLDKQLGRFLDKIK